MPRRPRRLDHPRIRAVAATVLLGLAVQPAPAVLGQDATADPPPAIGPFEDVPTYRVDGSRQNLHPGAAPRSQPGVAWSVQLGDEIHFNPIVLDGTLFVGDYAGTLHAIDPATGQSRWSYAAEGAIDGATGAEGTVVFADGSGRLHAVDARNGQARWVADGGYTSAPASLAVTDGTVYGSTEDGVLRGLDLASGEEVWAYEAPAPAPSLTILDGIAYVGTTAGQVLAVSLGDGSQAWPPIRLLSSRPSSMAIAEGILFAASNQPPGEPAGELLAIEAATGQVAWRFRSPSGRQVTPGAVRAGVLYVASENDGLYAIDALTGATIWRVEAPPTGAPVPLAGDVLLVSSLDGELIAYDAVDGAELWRVPLGDGTDTGPAVTGGLVFQADWSGTLWAFGDARPAQAPVTATSPPTVAPAAPITLELVATWDAATIEGLDQPCGGDVTADGHFAFVNCGTSEVIVVDAAGNVVRRWGEPGTREGEFDFLRDRSDPFSAIGGVAVGEGGSFYVADTVNRRVQQFAPDGSWVRQFGSYGSGDGQFLEPIDVAAGPDGSIYVVDDVRDDIQRFTADGRHLQTIGRHGTGAGELSFTASIFVSADGTLHNADWENNRVQAWDADGRFLWTLGTRGDGQGEFRSPADVGVDDRGNLFVADFDNLRIQVFGPDREFLTAWNAPGTGEQDLIYSLTVARDGRIYVGNPFGDRIHVVRFAEPE